MLPTVHIYTYMSRWQYEVPNLHTQQWSQLWPHCSISKHAMLCYAMEARSQISNNIFGRSGRRGRWTRLQLATKRQRTKGGRRRKLLLLQLLQRQPLLKLRVRSARHARWRRRQCRSSAASFARSHLPLSAVSHTQLWADMCTSIVGMHHVILKKGTVTFPPILAHFVLFSQD